MATVKSILTIHWLSSNDILNLLSRRVVEQELYVGNTAIASEALGHDGSVGPGALPGGSTMVGGRVEFVCVGCSQNMASFVGPDEDVPVVFVEVLKRIGKRTSHISSHTVRFPKKDEKKRSW